MLLLLLSVHLVVLLPRVAHLLGALRKRVAQLKRNASLYSIDKCNFASIFLNRKVLHKNSRIFAIKMPLPPALLARLQRRGIVDNGKLFLKNIILSKC